MAADWVKVCVCALCVNVSVSVRRYLTTTGGQDVVRKLWEDVDAREEAGATRSGKVASGTPSFGPLRGAKGHAGRRPQMHGTVVRERGRERDSPEEKS